MFEPKACPVWDPVSGVRYPVSGMVFETERQSGILCTGISIEGN